MWLESCMVELIEGWRKWSIYWDCVTSRHKRLCRPEFMSHWLYLTLNGLIYVKMKTRVKKFQWWVGVTKSIPLYNFVIYFDFNDPGSQVVCCVTGRRGLPIYYNIDTRTDRWYWLYNAPLWTFNILCVPIHLDIPTSSSLIIPTKLFLLV